MKTLVITLCFALSVGWLNGQTTKIKIAEQYFNSYRYADANPIYKELIFKDKIPAEQYPKIYRHAANSSMMEKDFWMALKYYELLFNSSGFDGDDAYELFKLNNLLGRYEKLPELLELPQLANLSGSKAQLLTRYKNEKPWNQLLRDTLGARIDRMAINSGKGDFGPVILPDGLAFSSYRSKGTVQYGYDDAPFIDQFHLNMKTMEVRKINDLKYKRHDGAAFYDSVDHIWYYSRNLITDQKSGVVKTGIYTYNEKSGKEAPLPFNSTAYFTAQPFYDRSNQRLYFSSDRPGGSGGADIWYSVLENGKWGAPINAGATINTIENEMFPSVYDHVLYFSSNGHPGLGGLDLFKSDISNEMYAAPENMGYPVNSYGDDLSLVLLADGQNGFYTSGRKDYLLVDDLYRIELLNTRILLHARLFADYREKDPMKGQWVFVKDDTGTVTDTIQADDNGEFYLPLKKNKKYEFEIRNDQFDPFSSQVTTFEAKGGDTLQREFLLQPKNVVINSTVRDKQSGKPLSNSKIQFKNKKTGDVVEVLTDDEGKIKVELPRYQEFQVEATKKGYIDDMKELNTNTREKEVHNEMDLDFVLEKFKTGTTIQIENVFYDLNKANLRPESKIELDKLAEFLLKNDNIQVELSSHTDSRGSDQKNMTLSQARAQSCVDYLITKGVSPSNIVAKGYGESRIINRCKNGVKCSEAEHQLNRRTEIKILSVRE